MKCIWTQWRLTRRIDEGERPGAALQRHLDECPACAHFYQTQRRLQQALRHPGEPAPTGMHHAVMRAVRAAPETPEPLPAWRYWMGRHARPAVAAALALLLIAAAGVHWRQRSRVRSALTQLQRSNARMVQAACALPSALGDPLPREIRYLTSDARRAAEFVLLQLPRLQQSGGPVR